MDTQALWLTANTTADIVWAVDPTVTDSVEVTDSVMVDVNIDDYQLLFRNNYSTSVRLNKPVSMSFLPSPEDVNDEIEGGVAEDVYEFLEENLRVTFYWYGFPGATEYNLQLSMSEVFENSDDMVLDITTSNTNYGTGNTEILLTNGVTYYWRVKSDNSSWSSAWTIYARDIEFQNQPIDDSNTGIRPTFSWWGHIEDVTNYTLEVSRMREFNVLVYSDSTSELEYVMPSNLDANTTYYWRIKNDISDVYSSVFEFTTDATAENIYPANNSENVMPTYISWKALDNATTYNVEIATDSLFTDVTFELETAETSYDFAANDIDPNILYFWHVNCDVAADWSETTQFFTNATPILESPAEDATNVGLIKMFEWDDFDGASEYELQISESDDFVTTVLDTVVEESEYVSIFDMQFNTTYFWRVQADSLGWNGSRSFTTMVEDAINTVELDEPVNEATSISLLPECSWGSNNSDYYMFYLSGSADFANILVTEQVDAASYTIEEDDMLIFGNTYYWKVASSKSYDSSVFQFTVRNGRPQDFEAEAKSAFKIDFSWSDITSNEDGFEIYKSDLEEGEFELIGTVGEDETSFVEFDLAPNSTYYYKARTLSPTGESIYTPTVSVEALGFNLTNDPIMVTVAAGTYSMGDNSGNDDEAPAHDVTLSNAFEIGKYEISNDEFCELLNWALGKGKVEDIEGYEVTTNYADDAMGIDDIIVEDGQTKISFNTSTKIFEVEADFGNHPVEDVTWAAATLYANSLGSINGFSNLYSGTNSIQSIVYGEAGYRLPTEAEWEYVAKFNDGRTYPWGNEAADGTLANYYGSGNGNTTLGVGSLIDGNNSLAVSDMAGNVWEWCNDKYDAEYYGEEAVTNPEGPSGNVSGATAMVIRGGSYEYSADELRNANRSSCKSNLDVGRVNTGVGFRLVKLNY